MSISPDSEPLPAASGASELRRAKASAPSCAGGSHSPGLGDPACRSGVEGQLSLLQAASSSEVMLPSSDGVDVLLGILLCCRRLNAANRAGLGDIFDTGEMPMLHADCLHAEGGIGQCDGDGMTREGYLALVGFVALFFTESEHIRGTSTESSSVRVYSSSSESTECGLLHKDERWEVASEDGVISVDPGCLPPGWVPHWWVLMFFNLAIGLSYRPVCGSMSMIVSLLSIRAGGIDPE